MLSSLGKPTLSKSSRNNSISSVEGGIKTRAEVRLNQEIHQQAFVIQGCLLTEAKFNQTLFNLRFLRLIFQLAGLFGPDTEKDIITASQTTRTQKTMQFCHRYPQLYPTNSRCQMEKIQVISFTLLCLSTLDPVKDWTNRVIFCAHPYLGPMTPN